MILSGVMTVLGFGVLIAVGVLAGSWARRRRLRESLPFPGERWTLPAGPEVQIVASGPEEVTYRLAEGSEANVPTRAFVTWCRRVERSTGPGSS